MPGFTVTVHKISAWAANVYVSVCDAEGKFHTYGFIVRESDSDAYMNNHLTTAKLNLPTVH